MFKRLATIAILAGAAAVIPAGPAAAEQHCGTVAANRQTVRVAVRGRVSCRRARNIAKSYISGRGTFHPARSYGATTITIPGGWICRSEEGGSAGCFSGGSPKLQQRSRCGRVDLDQRIFALPRLGLASEPHTAE